MKRDPRYVLQDIGKIVLGIVVVAIAVLVFVLWPRHDPSSDYRCTPVKPTSLDGANQYCVGPDGPP